MQNVVNIARHMYKFGNIVVIKLKIGQGEEVLNVLHIAGNEVVHANHMVALTDEFIAEV